MASQYTVNKEVTTESGQILFGLRQTVYPTADCVWTCFVTSQRKSPCYLCSRRKKLAKNLFPVFCFLFVFLIIVEGNARFSTAVVKELRSLKLINKAEFLCYRDIMMRETIFWYENWTKIKSKLFVFQNKVKFCIYEKYWDILILLNCIDFLVFGTNLVAQTLFKKY